jgi:TPR repeat protein
LYIRGVGVGADRQRGAQLIQGAATSGFAGGQFNLGVLLEAGIGLPKNLVAARNWYLLAAEGGSAQAQFNLGILLLQPEAGKPDPVEAFKWLLLAAKGEVPELRRQAKSAALALAQRLTREQVARAGDAAMEWARQRLAENRAMADIAR